MFSYTAALLTLILGPALFAILSRTIYRQKPSFPTQINDGIGDVFFLPLINGALFAAWKVSWVLAPCIVVGFFIALAYVLYQMNASYVDWSKPRVGKLNMGGYYHAFFMWMQVTLVLYGLYLIPTNIFFLLGLGGYGITAGLQIIMTKRL